MTSGVRLDRRGVSLPMVILMMALLAVAVTAGFARVSEERRIVGDQQAQVDAFAVAQSGIERYVALRDTVPGAYDSVAIAFGTRDTAYVVLFRIRDTLASQPGLYVIRSRGVSRSAPRFSAATPTAQRTVAQYAQWFGAAMDVDAAWTSISGIRSPGSNGTISGNDECGIQNVAGIAVPEHIAPAGLNGFDPPPLPTGAPGVDTLGALPADVADQVHIDWTGIVFDSLVTPDYVLTSTGGWPAPNGTWPTIQFNGSTTLDAGQVGQGLLIASGDLILTTGFQWLGVILVGGRITVLGTPNIHGAVVTGLDVKRGYPITESNIGVTGTDNITVRYNSCYVANALARYAHLQLIPNAWTDNWPEN
jgi:hypothetical protein